MKKYIEAHKFFIKESRTYVGKPKFGVMNHIIAEHCTDKNLRNDINKHNTYSLKAALYFPVAYIKFMWLIYKG